VAIREAEVRRRWPILPFAGALAAVLVVTAIVVVTSDGSDGAPWRSVGTIDDLKDREVLFLPELDAYVILGPDGTPVTLIAKSTQMGEPVVYCATSEWFEDAAHGSKFDAFGRYALGPAPRGLDRFPTVVRNGIVLVDPSRTLLGPPRTDAKLVPPAGPFCVGEA
jgi:hypothetical protein